MRVGYAKSQCKVKCPNESDKHYCSMRVKVRGHSLSDTKQERCYQEDHYDYTGGGSGKWASADVYAQIIAIGCY